MAAMFKRFLQIGAVALLTFGTFTLAAELRRDHPDSYVVRKGDTLWDIAARFLEKPWLWPEIWQANPQIENPHLIYPGDVISLAYLRGGQPALAAERGPEARSGELPIDTVPLAEIEPFLRKLRVVDSIEGMPYVVALEEDRLRSSGGQVIYARGVETALPGDTFAVVRPLQRYNRSKLEEGGKRGRATDLDQRGKVHHRDLEAWWSDVLHREGREFLGVELAELTLAQVTRGPGGGSDVTTLLLLDESREVRAGDRLVKVEPQSFDLQFFPHPPKQQHAYGHLQILSVADGMHGAGPRFVVAISGGHADGIENGTVFSIWNSGKDVPDRVKYRNAFWQNAEAARLPDDYIGTVMVFRTFEKVSYGLVMDGIRPARVGDVLKHPDATR